MATGQPPSKSSDSAAENIGCGLFLLIAGVVLLAERMKWIPAVDWLLPAVLVSCGVGMLVQAIRKK